MKFLYLAKNNIEAEIIKDKLMQLNINSYILGSNLHMAIGELPLESLHVKIFVDDNDYDIAYKFIIEYKNSFNFDDKGLWICPKCNEKSPNSINICWKCGFDHHFKKDNSSSKIFMEKVKIYRKV